MTQAEALERANQCERAALATTNAGHRAILRHMRLLWVTLAHHADELGPEDAEIEYERLMAVQAELASCETLH
jgi:hypothetical protein